jgi:hypothetical protein
MRCGPSMIHSPKGCRLPLWMLALLALVGAGNSAQAGVRSYLLIFSAQTHPKIPRKTHTFCTLVRVEDPPPGCPVPRIEVSTISWLPRTLKVRPYRFHDEPGYNLTLDETLRWAAQNHMQVKEWGPFSITEDFYGRVYREYVRFESGGYRYKAIDPANRGSLTSDCIHAVTDVDHRDPRTMYSVRNCGDRVTYQFVQILRERGRLQLPPDDVSWIDAALGVDRYPVEHCPPP